MCVVPSVNPSGGVSCVQGRILQDLLKHLQHQCCFSIHASFCSVSTVKSIEQLIGLPSCCASRCRDLGPNAAPTDWWFYMLNVVALPTCVLYSVVVVSDVAFC